MNLKPYLRKRYKTNDYGIINVSIPIGKGKYKPASTGIKVKVKDWLEKSGKVRSTVPNYETINEKNRIKIKQIEEDLNSNSINSSFSSKHSYLDFFKERLGYLERTEIGTYRKYNTVYNHLKEFCDYLEVEDIKFKDIDYEMVLKLVEFLQLDDIRAVNTINNYIKVCKALFNLALYRDIFKSYSNPFSKYKIKNEKIRRDVLDKEHIKNLLREQFPEGGNEEKAYHLFMIQIYGYGLRVSDLFLLRRNYIKFNNSDTRIEFTQFKTNKPHSILLSPKLLKHLYYYLNNASYQESYFKKIYPDENSETLYSYQELHQDRLNKLLKYGQESTEYLKADERTSKLTMGIYFDQIKNLKEKFTNKKDDFLLPILKSQVFESVKFRDSIKLNKIQYYHLMSKVAIYNKQLKLLMPFTGSNTNITTHTARHSFSNILLNDDVNLHSISKGLGHSNLSTTESYLKSFKQEKIDEDIKGSIGSLDINSF